MPTDSTGRLRGAIIVTGNEVLGGRVTDRNGPWLSQRFADAGVETVGIIQVGDRREDLLRALAQARDWQTDVIATSGGLGPTADDLTMEVVAEFQRRPLTLHAEMEREVWARVARVRERFPGIDEEYLVRSSRKQAMQPEGATPLSPVGTAPGSIVPAPAGEAGPPVVVLPGPPRELQPMWGAALTAEPLAGVLARATPFEERMHRLVGLVESDLAGALEEIERGGVPLGDLEITTCMRSGEIEIVTRYAAGDAATFEAFDAAIRRRWPKQLYSDDGSSVVDIVARLLRERGWTVALAESCTGGLVASALIGPAGASAYVRGGVVAYDNAVKRSALGVPAATLEEFGAVSPQVAEAMALGAAERLGADCGLSITGIAGPGGGSDDKPVGTVWFGAVVPGHEARVRRVVIPGDRGAIRDRATVAALHVLRRAIEAAGPATAAR